MKICGAASAAPQRLIIRLRPVCGSLGVTRTARFLLVTGEEVGQRLCFAIGGVRRRSHVGETQRLGEPAGVLEQALGLLGHLGLLEMVDQLRGGLSLGLTDRFEDPALGHPAEIVVDRRPPANLRHVETRPPAPGDPPDRGDDCRPWAVTPEPP